MSLNPTSLDRIQQLTKKIRGIDPVERGSSEGRVDIYELRIERESKRWKEGVKKNEKSIAEATGRINQLIESLEETGERRDNMGRIREKVVRELEEMERSKSKTSLKLITLKNSITPPLPKTNPHPQPHLQQTPLLDQKLLTISTQTSKLNKLILQTITTQFDKLDSRLSHQSTQQHSRTQQLHQMISALQSQFHLSVQFQQRQLTLTFQDHHHYLQRIIHQLSLTLQQ